MENAVPTRPPKSHGFLRALWSLWTPDRFESVKPTFRGLRYRATKKRGIKPRVDIYMPQGAGPHPSVILIHGGAFILGSRDMKPARFLASELVRAGFVVASMDYRMVLRGGRFTESREDVETMMSWWFSQADRYALNLRDVSMTGISAGAALMLMAATKHKRPKLARLVSVYGIYDFENLAGRPLQFLRKKLFRSSNPNLWRKNSPLYQFREKLPVLLIHGTDDRIVPVHQADQLVTSRRQEGLPVDYFRSNNSAHGFFNDAQSSDSKKALARLLDFLRTPIADAGHSTEAHRRE